MIVWERVRSKLQFPTKFLKMKVDRYKPCDGFNAK